MYPRRAALAIVVALAGLALAGGCDAFDDTRRASGHVQLVTDMATRLRGSSQLTYTADYQLPGGRQATVAIEGGKFAYTYPGGLTSVTPDTLMHCGVRGTTIGCTLNAVPASPGVVVAWAFGDEELAAMAAVGFTPPYLVADLLSAAALDADAAVRQHDSTIAGQHATCVDVSRLDNAAASAYDVCVTTDGVLGSFAATVRGRSIEMTLTSYRGSVSAAAFSPPRGAAVTDRRGTRP